MPRTRSFSPFVGKSDRSSLTVVGVQYARRRGRGVCFMPTLLVPSQFSPSRLPASFTRSTRHYRTGCCTLPFAAAAISCCGRLSHAHPRRLSHSGAPTGGSIDLRDSIVETHSPESEPDRSDYLEAGGRFLRLSPAVAKRKSAARSLNRRSYYAIVEELIKQIARSCASHE